MSWSEAVDLVAELRRESGSHLVAAIAGWAWAADTASTDTTALLQAYLNVHQDPEKTSEPIRLPFPWDEPEKPVEDISAAERAALIKSFDERSAMRDL